MRIPRIFTDQTLAPGASVELDERACRHVSQVLRLHAGQRVMLFDGSGNDFEAELTQCNRRSCQAIVTRAAGREHPAPLHLHLGIGVSRGERMDFAIQKSVELGVNAITPLFTERSGVQLKHERLDKRVAHWRGVAISACEQSGRSLLPALEPPRSLPEWLADRHDGLMLDHAATQTLSSLPDPEGRLNLLIGPEGGLSESERTMAKAGGFIAVGLGPRVLRTETAPIAALAAIQMLWGDFR